jgi:hypothetical protein
MDGKRMVVACSPEQLDQLIEKCGRRPFVEAELWAGKMARAMFWHSGEDGEDELGAETGLTPEQIRRSSRFRHPASLRSAPPDVTGGAECSGIRRRSQAAGSGRAVLQASPAGVSAAGAVALAAVVAEAVRAVAVSRPRPVWTRTVERPSRRKRSKV